MPPCPRSWVVEGSSASDASDAGVGFTGVFLVTRSGVSATARSVAGGTGSARRRQCVGQTVEDGRGLFIGEGEGRQQAYDAGVTAAEFDDEPAFQAFLLDCGGQGGCCRGNARGRTVSGVGVDEFDADHQPPAAYVPDAGVVGGQSLQLAHHACAEHGGAVGEPVLAYVRQGGGARRHGELVAAERTGVGTRLPGVEVGPVDHDGQRKAAADGLGHDHHIGHDATVLDRPEGAGPADSGLHLVGDQRDGAVRRDRAHAPHPVVRCGDHAALPLHRFEDHPGRGRHPALRVVEEVLGPAGGEFGAALAAHPEGAPVVVRIGQACHPYVLRTARGVEGARRHAVVRPGEGQQSAAAGGGAYELERGLDRVRTRGAAELDPCVVGESARQGREQLGDERVLDGGREVQHMERGPRVDDLLDRFQNHGVVVPERQGPGPREAVEVPAPVRPLDRQPTRPYGNDGQGPRVGARRRFTQ